MPAVPAAVDSLLIDLKTIFGPRLESLVMYGPHVSDPQRAGETPIHCLAIVQSLTFEDLRAAASQRGRWEKLQLATPLLLTREEFARSLDAFPFEYGEIIDHHRPILGDPFAGLRVAPDDRRRACEVQAKSHLLHLREGYLECGGRASGLAQLIGRSAAPLGALLRHVARLGDASARAWSPQELARVYEEATGMPGDAIRRVLALEASGQLPPNDAPGLYPDYLRGVEHLARALDRWREDTKTRG